MAKWNSRAACVIILKNERCAAIAWFAGSHSVRTERPGRLSKRICIKRANAADTLCKNPKKGTGKRLKKTLFRQILEFIGISGLGWLIDFAGYTVLTTLGVRAGIANFCSALPALTFVFFLATKKTFVEKEHGIPLGWKYALYVLYQFVLLTGVSFLNQTLFDLLRGVFAEGTLLYRYCALLTKIMITPITMFCNFIVLKRLAERI